jgi:hypothetical protein
VFLFTTTCLSPQSTARAEDDFSESIRNLSGAVFQQREAAHQQLLVAGSSAIDALERAARSEELEAAARCVKILARLARTQNSATAAMERLANDRANYIAGYAAATITELNTTDEDRAIAALEMTGARLHRLPNGGLTSVRTSHDFQLTYLNKFPKVRSVQMFGEGISDAGLKYLEDVKSLSHLTIARTSVTDNGLGALPTLKSLDHLYLAGAFTADGLQKLRHIPKLRTLSLNMSVDENDLDALIDVTQIESLYLPNCRFSQGGVDIINHLKHLRRLTLSVTNVDNGKLRSIGQIALPITLQVMNSKNVTEVGWEQLAGTHLVGLTVFGTPVTDGCLAHIGKIQTLTSLSIYDAPISDIGLRHLQKMPALGRLTLQETQVTSDGVAELKRAIPRLRTRLDGVR